ncbi:2Fe-2S ferredoxin [Desulfuribacillus stibiiarsenatis]|uniref:2Fe-2S ferredoxin n=1 Tax=Desulfuribacillus stibiiarsenatis TaxID=1390249 RepID=A0A1E5L3E4_9FIRM|nr:2Fe-2S ferredoxin [Desulfuribacillus stibiiarsenatis]OEH84642.1 2Fe-2S ferredoxin [Desulfuribacillus stibiiarsenatis]
MDKPKKHIFVCSSSRINGQQKGFCHSKDSVNLVETFMEELMDRGISGEVMVTNTGCLAICEKGPIVIVYPENIWYGNVSDDDVEEILDEHIEGGKPVERLMIFK